jgi:hypoxanthine phosphoribosyltransferase
MNYFALFIRAVQDVLADRTRRRVSKQEVASCCGELAQIIRQKYRPDLLVAIDTGGSIPGELIAKTLDIPIVHLVVRRDINITRRYNLDPAPLRWMMSIYHHFLFQTMKPIVSVNSELNVSGKKILIVEDTVHTGATIDIAINYLRQLNALEIKTASLAYVSNRKPDFSVLSSGNYSFPWSKDYDNAEV